MFCSAQVLFTLQILTLIFRCFSDNRPLLLWTSKRSNAKSTGIYSTYVNPKLQRAIKGFVLSNRVVALRSPHRINDFDINKPFGEAVILDAGKGNLVTVNCKTKAILKHHRGISRKANSLAVDWKNNNVYWTDQGREWIGVMSANFKNFNILVREVETPRGLVVYPQKGLMFWTQQSSTSRNPEIMQATLSGERRIKIATLSGEPLALALDYIADRLYWIEGKEMAIFHKSFENEDVSLICRKPGMDLKNIYVYRDWIFVTAKQQNKIMMLNKTDGKLLHVVNTFEPELVKITGGFSQSYGPGPCDIKNGGCEQFCFALPTGNRRKCGCDIGMELAYNGKNCISTIMNENFFLIADSDLQWIFQVSLDGHQFSKLSIPSANVPVQVDFDPVTSRLFWTDIGSASVNRASLDGSAAVILADKGVQEPIGIALDRYSGNLYWTDEGTGTISAMKTDGSQRRTILSQNVKLPRGLILNPKTGHMWWTDWGKQTIERAAMDGSQREVLFNSDLVWVNDLSGDFSRNELYWCDAYLKRVESASLAGSNRRVVFNMTQSSHGFAISLHDDFLYLTDWTNYAIQRIKIISNPNKQSESITIENFGPAIFDRPSDVAIVNASASAKNNDKNPCQVENGFCTGLCIPVPNTDSSYSASISSSLTRVCLCGADNDTACSVPVAQRDLHPPSFGNTCPGLLTFHASPCSNQAFVNYTIPIPEDNSGNISLEMPSQAPPAHMREGKYTHRYTAVDSSGNQATCKVTVIIEVVRCPPLHQLFDEISVVNVSCGLSHGSVAHLRCINAPTNASFKVLECNDDGKWKQKRYCPSFLSSSYSKPVTEATSSFFRQLGTTTLLPNWPNTREYQKSALHTTTNSKIIYSSDEHFRSDETLTSFDFAVSIPFLSAILIAVIAAVFYKHYRSTSIPLLAEMQRALSYKNSMIDLDLETPIEQPTTSREMDLSRRSTCFPYNSGGINCSGHSNEVLPVRSKNRATEST